MQSVTLRQYCFCSTGTTWWFGKISRENRSCLKSPDGVQLDVERPCILLIIHNILFIPFIMNLLIVLSYVSSIPEQIEKKNTFLHWANNIRINPKSPLIIDDYRWEWQRNWLLHVTSGTRLVPRDLDRLTGRRLKIVLSLKCMKSSYSSHRKEIALEIKRPGLYWDWEYCKI